MEKVCKWCSNYNKGECPVLNEKLNVDQPLIYYDILSIVEQFFHKKFRLYLKSVDLQYLAAELTNKIDSLVDAKTENPIIEFDCEKIEDFSCKYWR